MTRMQKIAVGYLLALALLIWGYQIGRHEVFPYKIIEEVSDFVAGHSLGTESTVAEKLASNVGLVPVNFLWPYPELAPAPDRAIEIPGLKSRRERPLMFMADSAKSGYRAIFGAMDFQDALWGGVLLDSNGELVHTWRLSTSHLRGNTERDEQKNMYGVHLYPDGSVIFNQQEAGGGIVKVNACGEVLWSLEGMFHHSVAPTGKETFWTYEGEQEDFDHVLAEISVSTGEVLRQIDMGAVRRLHPHLHIFDLQRNDGVDDISHGNDIDPMPEHLANDFPDFAPGSLLLSYRTQNLVFILNPETLAIEWWRIGPWDRQHDPDWEQGGKIAVFSNNQKTQRVYSDIIEIDPRTYEYEVVVDGSDFAFYSSINGNHQRTPFDSRMISSSTQGWVVEIDDSNEVIFSFLNLYNQAEREALHVSDALRLKDDYFDRSFWTLCE